MFWKGAKRTFLPLKNAAQKRTLDVQEDVWDVFDDVVGKYAQMSSMTYASSI